MEHRWGRRIRVEKEMSLKLAPGVVRRGRMRDVSVSGAFVEISEGVRAGARVTVWLTPVDGALEAYRIAAHVVRSEARGVGLEWNELGPAPVRALFQPDVAAARETALPVPPISAPGHDHGGASWPTL